MTYFAKCHCGAVEVKCDCEPDPVIICHCKLCRRRTGSLFQVAAWFNSESVMSFFSRSLSSRVSSGW